MVAQGCPNMLPHARPAHEGQQRAADYPGECAPQFIATPCPRPCPVPLTVPVECRQPRTPVGAGGAASLLPLPAPLLVPLTGAGPMSMTLCCDLSAAGPPELLDVTSSALTVGSAALPLVAAGSTAASHFCCCCSCGSVGCGTTRLAPPDGLREIAGATKADASSVLQSAPVTTTPRGRLTCPGPWESDIAAQQTNKKDGRHGFAWELRLHGGSNVHSGNRLHQLVVVLSVLLSVLGGAASVLKARAGRRCRGAKQRELNRHCGVGTVRYGADTLIPCQCA